jgi:pimeloyl-ACP methyl ester carboxylesterase
MVKRLFWLLGVLALLYVALCAWLFVSQRSLLYVPRPRASVPGAVMQALKTDAGDVLVTTRPHAGPKAVVYFGGNAEDAARSLPGLEQAFPDQAIYLLHYRSYGGSAGKPTEAALVADALQLEDQVAAEHPQVTVIGRSLGSGVAVEVAARRTLARLVLVTPFDSMVTVASEQYGFVPVRWLLLDRYESSTYAPRINAPTTVIVAADDELIPRRSTDRLTAAFRPGVAREVVINGVGHNNIGRSGQYLAALAGR